MVQSTQQIWDEISVDILTQTGLWQICIIVAACAFAWAVNGALRAYVLKRSKDIHGARETLSATVEGINRVLFPLTALSIVWLAKIFLSKLPTTPFFRPKVSREDLLFVKNAACFSSSRETHLVLFG